MQFIQTSDIHIGECRSLENYLVRHKSILQSLIDASVSRGKIPLIVPGDLFHTKSNTIEEKFLADWWLGQIEFLGIPAIITAGNHDHLYGEVTHLDGYMHMPFRNVKIVGFKPTAHIINDTGFICISWGGYGAKELKKIVEDLLPQVKNCKHIVALVHECMAGAQFDNGMILPKGSQLPSIDEITYWAVGDIHMHQRLNLPNAYYAGAPAQFKFDDVLPKGYLVVDLEKPTKPKFCPIHVKPLVVVNSVDQMTEDAYYMVKGSFEEVMRANQNSSVVKAEWIKDEAQVFEFQKLEITDGLPEFLSEKGLTEQEQKEAIEWVKNTAVGL